MAWRSSHAGAGLGRALAHPRDLGASLMGLLAPRAGLRAPPNGLKIGHVQKIQTTSMQASPSGFQGRVCRKKARGSL